VGWKYGNDENLLCIQPPLSPRWSNDKGHSLYAQKHSGEVLTAFIAQGNTFPIPAEQWVHIPAKAREK
jgi:hypothetical protein